MARNTNGYKYQEIVQMRGHIRSKEDQALVDNQMATRYRGEPTPDQGRTLKKCKECGYRVRARTIAAHEEGRQHRGG